MKKKLPKTLREMNAHVEGLLEEYKRSPTPEKLLELTRMLSPLLEMSMDRLVGMMTPPDARTPEQMTQLNESPPPRKRKRNAS